MPTFIKKKFLFASNPKLLDGCLEFYLFIYFVLAGSSVLNVLNFEKGTSKNNSTILLNTTKMVPNSPQPALTSLKLTTETLEQGVKYVQN